MITIMRTLMMIKQLKLYVGDDDNDDAGDDNDMIAMLAMMTMMTRTTIMGWRRCK